MGLEYVLEKSERNIALYMYKEHFCLIWKSQGDRFNKAIEELKLKFQFIHNVISKFKTFSNYEYNPKKIQYQ